MFSSAVVHNGVGQVTNRHPGRVHDDNDDEDKYLIFYPHLRERSRIMSSGFFSILHQQNQHWSRPHPPRVG